VVDEPLLSLEDVAKLLSVDYRTVFRLVRSGKLPAAKIGRIYRVNRADLKAFVEGAKDATSTSRSGSQPSGASICSACGRRFVSAMSVAGHCQVCSEPICSACWHVRDARFCRQHRDGGERAEHVETGTAHHDARGAFRVSVAEVRRLEDRFIQRFEANIRSASEIYDPVQDRTIHVGNWDARHVRSDADAELRVLARQYKVSPDVLETLPRNTASRFVAVPDGLVGTRTGEVVVIGQFVSRLAKLMRDGSDDRPLTTSELDFLIRDVQGQADAAQRFHILLLASPTGWSMEAREIINARERTQSYYHRYLSSCLLDLLTGELTANVNDRRIESIVGLLTLEIDDERVGRCVAAVRKILTSQRSVTLAKAGKLTGCDEATTRKAFARLARDERYATEEVGDDLVIFHGA